MHKTQFAGDLRAVRQNAGLTQGDCAILLAISQSAYSDIETGETKPSLRHTALLSVIFGKSFHSLYQGILSEEREALWGRLVSLPEKRRSYLTEFNRTKTLKRLRHRLIAKDMLHDA